MNKYFLILFLLLLSGCTPKLGKDILIGIEPGSVSLENTKTEISLTLLSFIGAPTEKSSLKLRGLLNIENKWWKDIELKSVKYSLLQDGKEVAHGKAIIQKDFINIESGLKHQIPLLLEVETNNLKTSKMLKRLTNKDVMEIEGTVVVSVFGKEFTTNFKNRLNS